MGLKYRDPDTGLFKELTVKASDTLPIGSMVPYGNINPPTGWLVCDGSAISRTIYADLFAVIGTSYGEGDGSTTFNLPNKKGKVSAGYDATNSQFNTLGKHIGEEKHTMTVEELAEHNHNTYTATNGTGTYSIQFRDTIVGTNIPSGVITAETGNNQPFNVIQPTEVDQWIIKAFQSIGVVAKVAQTETENNTDVYSCEYINNKLSNLSKTSIETGDTPPSNPSDGDLWIDTSDTASLAEVDDTVSTTSENAVSNKAITNYVNERLNGTLLWKNNALGDNFGPQTLNLDLSPYSIIELVYYRYPSITTPIFRVFHKIGETTQLNYCDYDSGTPRAWSREIQITASSLVIANNWINGNIENKGLVLDQVIGHK